MSTRRFSLKQYRGKDLGAEAGARVRAARQQFLATARRPRTKRSALLEPEIKYYDTALAVTTVAAATDATGGEYDPSATSMISTPAVGDGDQNRDGKRIIIKNVQIKGCLIRDPAEDAINPPLSQTVYVALVLDTQSNGAQMNSEDCFKNLSASVAGNTSPLRNLLFSNRFKVLKAECFNMDSPSVGVEGDNLHSSPGVSRTFEWFIPFMDGLVVNFNAGTTSSIANVVDNSLHVIAYAQNTTSTITYNARIRFQS